jgi:hypothetical protein
MADGNFFRRLRQLILLTLLAIVATGSYLTRTRSTSWEEPLWVTVYPIVADDNAVVRKYIDGLTEKNFLAIERFMEKETARYGVNIERPIRIDVGQPIAELPPPPPANGNPFRIAFWSLNLRSWAGTVTEDQPGAPPNIRLFLIYHDPEFANALPHSLGLQKGMLGIVHVFADRQMQAQNNVVIAHEMLHTLGATDKYALHSNLPIHPIGFADPDKIPLYPQKIAEVMGGRIPLSPNEAVMPESLKNVQAGWATALELRWITEAS